MDRRLGGVSHEWQMAEKKMESAFMMEYKGESPRTLSGGSNHHVRIGLHGGATGKTHKSLLLSM